MAPISYENIDLFYYHSIDIDFARFFSILNYGIVSKNVAIEEGIKYYYRNYTSPSSKNEYVSVNHFPRTILSYYEIENELYDFNTSKICFVLDGIIPLEKQAYNNRHRYTNERHVHHKINPSEIKGILLREVDSKKKLSEIPFNYKFTDKTYFENKVFATINFFVDHFGNFGNTDRIYYLIGKLREARISGMSDDIIIELISRNIQKNINFVMSSVLGINNPTLLEVISYFNNMKYPIYLMNRFDIQLADHELSSTDCRLEKFRENTNLKISELELKKSVDKKTMKLLRKMSDYGVDIYFDYASGPFTQNDFEIVQKIKTLSLKK